MAFGFRDETRFPVTFGVCLPTGFAFIRRTLNAPSRLTFELVLKSPITIEFLGHLCIRQGDRTTTRFRTHKTGVLLAYLAYYSERSHPREELIEMLWPECDPVLGRNSLSQSLSSLRHQLEPPGVSVGEVLRADRYSVQIAPEAIVTDVSRFESACAAFQDVKPDSDRLRAFTSLDRLYRGEFMPGYYEDLNLRERERLQQMFFNALVSRIDELESKGDIAAAIECGRRAVEIDPLNEPSHLRLMRLYAANDDHARAVKQYGELHKILSDELGVAPSADASALARELRSGIAVRTEKPPAPSAPKHARTKRGAERPARLSGIWAFLIVDVGSLGPEVAKKLLERHGGEKIEWLTSVQAALFGQASDALDCAIAIQTKADKKIRPADGQASLPRLALHVGETRAAGESGEKGVRMVVDHAVALLDAGHAGQLVCSEAVASILMDSSPANAKFQDLGSFRLKGDERAEHVYQADHVQRSECAFPPLNADAGYAVALPRHLSRFFGRETEIARLNQLLDPANSGARLLTITGPGGTGKTRLSVEAARSLEAQYRNAIWFVPLADIKEPDLLPSAILAAMQTQAAATADPLKHLVSVLGRNTSLLVLDNFEHWLSETSPEQAEKARGLVRKLLESVPTLHCLVTSRRRLGLIGEAEFFLEPLPTPDARLDLEATSSCESVQLFIDRSQSVRPSFQITNANSPTIAEICRRLEGIPLAIELAAAKSQVLTQTQILDGLANRLDFLADRRRQTEERHQKLRVTIDWSYQMLVPEAQDFFASLSIFRGGANLADVEAICDEPLALDYLALLQDFSFVTVRENSLADDMRFRLLETLREYADEKLTADRRADLQRRHAHHYLQVAEDAAAMLKTGAQSKWLHRFEQDHQNFLLALDRCAADRDLEAGLRLGCSLGYFWETRGHARIGRGKLEELWALAEHEKHIPLELRASVLTTLGTLAIATSDFSSARDLHEKSLELYRELNDTRGQAQALSDLGRTAFEQGDYSSAQPYATEGLQLWRELNDDFGSATALNTLGLVACEQGDYPTAIERYHESLELRRAVDDTRGIAIQFNNLGVVYRRQGDYAGAKAAFSTSLEMQKELGNRRSIASGLSNLGLVAEHERAYDHARALQEESLAIRSEIGDDWGVARSLAILGIVDRHEGNDRRAQTYFEESLAICRRMGNKLGIGQNLCQLGDLFSARGDADTAQPLLRESLELMSELNNKQGLADVLQAFSRLALVRADYDRSARLFVSAQRMREAIGAQLPPYETAELAGQLADLQTALDKPALDAAMKAGRELNIERSIGLASQV